MNKKLTSVALATVIAFSQASPLLTYAVINESESPRVQFIPKSEIALGVPTTGDMSGTNTYDWYKVVLKSDGHLELGLKGPLKTKGIIRLFDGNGVKEIKNKSVESVNEGKIDAYLLPGTYYVKIERSANDWSYTLNNAFTATTKNDTEPNDIYKDATTIGPNDSKAGHLGYYKEDYTDNTDYWMFDVTEEGLQKISVNALNDLRGNIKLYDKAKKEISSAKIGYESKTNATIEKHLAPGRYYVSFVRDASFNPGEYTIDTTLTKSDLVGDIESNNVLGQASQIEIGKTYKGNLGAYEKNTIDTLDWYKFNLAQDGEVTFNVLGQGDVSGKISLFKSDGQDVQKETVLGKEGVKNGSVTLALKAGSYYFKVETSSNKVWSYEFSSSYKQVPVTEDRPWEGAGVMPLNGNVSGRIDKSNTEKWHSVTTDKNGTLNLKINTSSSPGSYVVLYDIEGSKEIKNTWIDGNATTYDIATEHLRPGKYYVKILRWHGDREYNYTLSNTLTPATYETDKESNDDYGGANTISIGDTVTGNLGYYSRKTKDDFDWYKVEMPADGLFKMKLETVMANGSAPGSYISIYDEDNVTSQILNEWMDDGKEYNYQKHLAKGTYYIKLQRWHGDRVYSYKLTTSIDEASLENDEELQSNNNIFQNSDILPLDGSTTGYLGYYTNGYTDNDDWYKVTTNQDGNLTIKLDSVMAQGKTPGAYMKLYDIDGTQEIENIWIDSADTGVISRKLKPGTYYVRLQRWHGDRIFSYTLSSEFVKAPLEKDVERNDIPELAKDINVNSLITGHLGYYSDRKTDDYDYYKINNSQKGSLTVNMVGTIKPGSYVKLLNEKLQDLGSLWVDDFTPSSKTYDNLEPGNYYLLAQRWHGDRIYSYILSNTFETGNEAKPNVINTYPRNLGYITQDSFKEGLGTPVFAQFNKQIDVTTINADNFYIKDSNGQKIVGTPEISGTMAYIAPDYPLEIGKTYTAYLSANVKDKNGNIMGQDYSWSFTVSDVESPGEVTKVTGVSLNEKNVALKIGDTRTLISTVLPENATNKDVEWTSSNKQVATVLNGKVNAVGEGTAQITVKTSDGGHIATSEVTVAKKDIVDEYKPWDETNIKTVMSDKEWMVTFNSPVDITSAEQNIVIKEKETGKVFRDVFIKYDSSNSDKKSIIIKHSTQAGFEKGKTYILYIGNNTKTLDGTKSLKTGYKLEFNVQ